MGTAGANDSDEMKRVLLEGNPYLLVLTGVVSMFHTVFDMLAFKNDIGGAVQVCCFTTKNFCYQM